MKKWLLAIRPQTLTAALAPCFLAICYASIYKEDLSMVVIFCALLSSVFIQIGTNLVNDAKDFEKGTDREDRLGPQRLVQQGKVSSQAILKLGLFCFLLALLLGIPLVLQGGWPILTIGIFSLLMGYMYTGGPYPLAYHGLGDLFVLIFFGWVAVLGLLFLLTGQWLWQGWVLGSQVGLHAVVLIAINNLRDLKSDIKTNKKTLSVRIGLSFSRWYIAGLILMPFALTVVWLQQNYHWAALLPWFVVGKAWDLLTAIFKTEPSTQYNQFLAQAAKLHLLFALLTGIGFLLQ